MRSTLCHCGMFHDATLSAQLCCRQGDETYEPVALGNLMARIAAWLMVLGESRGVKAHLWTQVSTDIR